MLTYPPAEESRDRRHRAGSSVGEAGSATGRWLVAGLNGENQISEVGAIPDEAWHRACEQAAALGMVAPVRGRSAWPRGRR